MESDNRLRPNMSWKPGGNATLALDSIERWLVYKGVDDGSVLADDIATIRANITDLSARLAKAEGLLRRARGVLALCTTRTFDALPEDPIARDLGERLGYGALMSAASKEWAAANARIGIPPGAQHTCGPCESTVERVLGLIDAHLRGKDGR